MNLKENLIQRVTFKQSCEADDLAKAAALELCKRDILHFFNFWLWTYDPRQNPSDLPFMPWDYQQLFILNTNHDIINGQSALTEKSRDMGVTWMVLGVFLYRWLFFDESFLLGSKVEGSVDTLGNMDSHFERLRYMLSKLPEWMTEALGYSEKNSSYMKIFKLNGSSIVGESMNKNFSRQGRYKAILLDEFAFVDGAELIWRACGDSAPAKFPVSTPNGRNNYFAQLRDSGKIRVNTIHWKMHPHKDEAWYEEQVRNRTSKDVAQELDINYTVSAGEPFYEGFSRALHVRKMNISKDKPLVLSWDFGFQHPNCSIHQISAEGIWIIVDNIFGEDQLIDEFGIFVQSYLNVRYKGFYFGVGYCDPAGAQSSDKTRMSSVQILMAQGYQLRYIPSNLAHTNYTARKNIIERKLKTLIGGIPALVVNDTPANNIIIEGFEGGYRYPDATKYGGIKEQPAPDNYFEHPFNTIEYFAINVFKPLEHRIQKPVNRLHIYNQEPMQNAGISF